MLLPVAIHKDDGSVFGVTVPDLPGCHSWGDTMDEAVRDAKEAIYGHVGTLLELGEDPHLVPSSMEALSASEEFAGATWALVDIDLAELDPKPERVNISLPRFILRRIDAYAASHHQTRSGFLAAAAVKAMAEP